MEDERWIEAEYVSTTGDQSYDEEPDVGDLFADPDPYDTFVHEFGPHKIELRGFKEENGQTIPSTGLTLWRAAPLLCDFLHQNTELVEGKRVLELGAGLGLCGIFAEKLAAAEVFLTDGDTDTLAQLRENVESNGCSKTICPQLRWGHRIAEFVSLHGQFDVILAADIIYVEEIIEPLFDTVVALMKEKFLLSYARRNVKIDLVLECAERHSLKWTQPTEAEGVYVFEHKS
jgi:16S rRNA G966 N2-methylase RsmD